MTKYLIFTLFLAKTVYSHDTLKFVKSYVLYKVPTVFVIDNSNDVCLPVQYSEVKKDLKITYKKRHSSDDEIHHEISLDGTEFISNLIGNDSLVVDTVYNKIILNNFIDTVYISKDDLVQFKPYIKTKLGNIHLVDFNLILIKDSIIKSYKIKNSNSGRIFEDFFRFGNIDNLSNVTFILNKSYYRIKDTVYSLNRQFVIIIK
jgi:hypothetical protein